MVEPHRTLLATGALLAAVGITLGAFGAHALRGTLDAQRLDWWHTATQYLMWNAIGLVALSAVAGARISVAAVLIAAGACIFAASLYVMALTGARWLGAVTPIGGLGMIAGWLLIAWQAFRMR